MRAAAVAAALLLLAAAAAADEVRLRDGRVLEGTILEDGAAGVKIRLRFGGEMTVPRADVASVERKELPEDAIARKRAALDPKDAEGRWLLSKEAREAKLRKLADELLDDCLRVDPGHAAANEAKGRVLHEGAWVTPAERDRRVAAKEKEGKAAAGLVEYKGRWVTPEERDALERGLVFKDGRWMSEREAKALDGLVEFKGMWVKKEDLEVIRLQDAVTEAAGFPLTAAQSERFVVLSVYPQADTNQYLADAERAHAEFCGIFGVGPKERLFDDPFNKVPRRCTIVVFEKETQYQKFVDSLLRIHDQLKSVLREETIRMFRTQKGFYLIDPDCWIVGYQFPFPKEQTRHTVVHKLSHVMLMRRNFRTGWLGWWLLEGFGELQEVNAFGNCQVYCSTTGYGEAAPDAKGVGESWKATAKRMAVAGGDTRLQDLFVRGLNDLSPFDLVKSWSLVHYLVALDREKFVALVMAMKGGPGVARIPADEAVRKVYGMSVDELDGKWRDFVRRTY